MTNSREYERRYRKMRRFLYRLEHPAKSPGVKPGYKFKRRVKGSAQPIPRYEWDRT